MAKDRPSTLALRAFVVLSSALLPNLVVAQYPSLPGTSDVFIGEMTCSAEPFKRGIRFTITEWPKTATFDYYEYQPTLPAPNCTGSMEMKVEYDGTAPFAYGGASSTEAAKDGNVGIRIVPHSSASTWKNFSASCPGRIVIPAVGFDGQLEKDNITYAGRITSGGACAEFTTLRQIGWAIRGAPTMEVPLPYASLKTCGPGTFQSWLVLFECPLDGTSETQIVIPAGREILAFETPAGFENFTLVITAPDAVFKDLDMRIEWGGGSQHFSMQENNVTFSIRPDLAVDAECAGGYPAESTMTCLFPETPFTIFMANKGSQEAFVTLNFQYSSKDCDLVPPAGCSKFDHFYAEEARNFWSRSLRAVASTKTEARNFVRRYVDKHNWAIPWYWWQAAFTKPLTSSWNNDWNDWRFSWALVFRVLDVNQDGYVTLDEYDAGFDMQAPVCPLGEKRISPIILDCLPRKDVEARFSMRDPRSRTSVLITAGTVNLTIQATGGDGGDVDLSVADVKSLLVVGNSLSAYVNSDNKKGNISDVSIVFSGDQQNVENVSFIGFNKKSTNPYGLQAGTTPWKLSLNTYLRNATGSYLFSNDERKSPNAGPLFTYLCENTTTVSGCSSYNPSLAKIGAQVWGSLLAPHGQYASAYEFAVFKVYDQQFLPWFNWFQYWKKAMATVPIWTEQTTHDFEQASTQTTHGFEHVFKYADNNNDGYVSPNEFELLRSVKVKYCDFVSGYYQNRMLLFGSSFQNNGALNYVGSGCGSYGSESTELTIGNHSLVKIATLPKSLQNFEIVFNTTPVGVWGVNASLNYLAIRLYNTKQPGSTANSTIQLTSEDEVLGVTTPSKLLFNVQASFENVSNSSWKLKLIGTLSEDVELVVFGNKSGNIPINFTYRYDGLSNCTSPPHGCSAYDNNLAKADALAWSTNIAGKYNSGSAGWEALKPFRTLLDSIPLQQFYIVWALGVSSDVPLQSLWMRGFKFMDLDSDLVVSEAEFQTAYNLGGSSQMVTALLSETTMATNQYQAADFPLRNQLEVVACHCSVKLNEGWSSTTGMCMKKANTDCIECKDQRQCASMHTVAGAGVRDFEGDCSDSKQLATCTPAAQAALSFPVAIAIDEENNMYIADYGNNRIRLVPAGTDTIETIAGSGRMGFSGDGGPGQLASLRNPDGITVNWKKGTARAREVFFSDHLNQRIRKVVLTGAVWRIYTVLGTGVRGENPACDAGCSTSDGILNNPRALAFTLDQDLYIVDSGNRKIRKFTVYEATPVLSTFIGNGAVLDKAFGLSLKVFDAGLLSGSWEEMNRNVALQSIYNIQVDAEDNLWFADASNNRMFMAPAKQSESLVADGYIGRYLEYFQLHFHRGQLPEKYQRDILSKMSVWLPLEDPALFESGASVMISQRTPSKFGMSYWKFASPTPGNLCRELNVCTKPEVVQFQKFRRLLGNCFDAGGDMFVGDQTQSILMRVTEDAVPKVKTRNGPFRTTRFDERNCPCLQSWIDWEKLGLRKPQVERDFANVGSLKAEQMCIENLPIGQVSIKPFMLKACSVSNYCTEEAVPWCFVNTAKAAKSYCTDGGKGWGFCPTQDNHEITFERFDEGGISVIMGHEMRKNMRCTFRASKLGQTIASRLQPLKSLIQWYDGQVTTTYPCDPDNVNSGLPLHQPPYNVLPWSQLLGFQEPDEIAAVVYGPARWAQLKAENGITSPCNGLKEAEDTTGKYCVIENSTHFDALVAYGAAMNNTPTYLDLNAAEMALAKDWFGIVLVWSSPRVHGTGPDDVPDNCADRCRIDPDCKAYVTSPVQEQILADIVSPTTTTTTSGDAIEVAATPLAPSPYTCMLFSETWPYSVYKYNSSATKIRDKWSLRPVIPATRMFNFNYGSDPKGINYAYINTFKSTSSIYGLVGGPYPNRSLLLKDCKETCALNSNCVSIVFPGCYLFSNAVNWTQQDINPGLQTRVFVKRREFIKVEKVTGTPNVHAFSNNKNGGDWTRDDQKDYASDSLVNRPGGCAFNSKGELFFADTWNHRVRKISSMHVECQYNMELFNAEDVNLYRSLVNEMDNKCFTNATAPFKNTSVFMQQSIVQRRELKFYEENACRFNSVVAQTYLPTQNLLVLCAVCKELENRKSLAGCPSVEICACRESIVKVLSTEVYLNCPSASAYYEKWHRFISAYIVCWFSQGVDDAFYLSDVGKSALKFSLKKTIVV